MIECLEIKHLTPSLVPKFQKNCNILSNSYRSTMDVCSFQLTKEIFFFKNVFIMGASFSLWNTNWNFNTFLRGRLFVTIEISWQLVRYYMGTLCVRVTYRCVFLSEKALGIGAASLLSQCPGSLKLVPRCSAECVQGQPGLHRNTAPHRRKRMKAKNS